jgi:hypothetical protein
MTPDRHQALRVLSEVIGNRPRPLREFDQIFIKADDIVQQAIRSVRPSVSAHAEAGRTVNLVMQKMTSRQFAEPDLAEEYSEDGVNWRPVPRGVEVRGSRYAMVLGTLKDEDVFLNLNALQVWDGHTFLCTRFVAASFRTRSLSAK